MKVATKVNVKFLLQILLFNIILFIFILQEKNTETITLNDVFQIPVITQQYQIAPKQFINTNYINDIFPILYGKYDFSDSIRLELKYDTFVKDLLRYSNTEDSSEIISANGLQLIADFQKDINILDKHDFDSTTYYPVYLVNETKSTKLLHGKSSYLFAIQEARDSNGTWRPIEMKGFDFCGNGRWALKVYPREFAVFTMPKYNGNYETDLRVRLKNGDNILISNSFSGKINYNQFHLIKDSYFQEMVKDRPLDFKSYWFYDAFPLDLELH